MADLELALKLTGDGGDLRGEVRLTKGDLDKLTQSNDAVDKSGRRAGRGLEEGGRGAGIFRRGARELNTTGGTLGRTLNTVARAAGYAAGLLGGISLTALITDMTRTIYQAEELRGALLSAVGGVPDLADKAFRALEQFASTTPFALEQSVEAFIKMQNLGIRPTEERMRGFGNTAAAMGKDLNQMIEAVADASTGEFERLKEFGIKASQQGDKVRFTFQGVTTEVAKDSDAIVAYLTNIGNNKFGDAMANQMERLPGLWSNLKDNISGIWRDIGDAGATDIFSRWTRAGVEWTADIRATIKAGWFDWMGAELDVQLARFSGWWDLLKAAGEGWLIAFKAEWQAIFAFFDTDGTSVFEHLHSVIGFVGDAIADLPANLRALSAIAIGEAGKASASIDELVFTLVNRAQLAWENLSYTIESVLLLLKQKAAEAVEAVIHKLGELVSEFSATLAAINNTGVGDALISDAALASIQQAGVAMQAYSGATQQAAADIAATNAEHQAAVTALDAERAGIQAQAQARKAAADEFIDAALAERNATLATRDAKVQDAEAAAAAARAGYEHALATKAEKVSLDDVTASTQDKAKATQAEVDALNTLLDRLDPARAAQRQYANDLKVLTARLDDGTLSQNEFNDAKAALKKELDNNSTALDKLLDRLDPARAAMREYTEGMAELNAALAAGRITQDEFNTAVGALEKQTAKAVGGVLSEIEVLETAWKRGIERIDDTVEGWLKDFLRSGKVTFDGVLDLFLDMLAEMIYAAARNKIVLAVTTGSVTGAVANAGVSAASGAAGSTGLLASGASLYSTISGAVSTGLSNVLASAGDIYTSVGNYLLSAGGGTSSFIGRAGASALDVGRTYSYGSVSSGLLNIGGNLLAGYAGSALGQKVFGGDTTGLGATAGGVVGSIWGPVGTAIGSFIGEGLETAVNKVLGIHEGGNNAARATLNTADGSLQVVGTGKNTDPANTQAAQALGEEINRFAQLIGGSDFQGIIDVGSKHGIKFQGTKYSDADTFLQTAYRQVIEQATGLDDTLKTMLLGLKGNAESIARDTADALNLHSIFEASGPFFDGIDEFEATFQTLTQSFRRDGEGINDTIVRLEAGLALLGAAGQDAARTVDNFQRAEDVIDRVGLETANNLLFIVNTLGDGVNKQFQAQQDLASRTNLDVYETLVQQNRDLIAAYDGTVESSAALAQATTARRESELALLSELEAATANVTGRIADFREQLILDSLDTEGQYNRYRDQIESLVSQIATAGSAAQVDSLEKQAEGLARTAYGLLGDQQKDAARPEFLAWLDTLEQAATDRLGEIKDQVVTTSETVDTETQTAIWDKAGLAGEGLQAAGTSLQTAAAMQQDVVQDISELMGQLTDAVGAIDAAARSVRDLLSIPQGEFA